MNMSRLDLFIVIFPVKNLNDVMIPQRNNVLEPATDNSESFYVWYAGFT